MLQSHKPSHAIPVLETKEPHLRIVKEELLKFKRCSLSPESIAYFESVMKTKGRTKKMRTYLENTRHYLSQVVPPDKRILVIGCLTAEIVESLKPAFGVGIDSSVTYIEEIKSKNTNPRVSYHCGLPEDFTCEDLAGSQKFDYIILLNIVDHSQDVIALLDSLGKYSHENSRVLVSMMNPLWHSLIQGASRLGIRIPDFKRNLVASQVLKTGLEIKQFKVMDVTKRVLFPKAIPGISWFFNQFLAKLPILNAFCFLQYVTARPHKNPRASKLSCSVIIPCYNEQGNIEECVRRVPPLGYQTEIVVVNDGSKDKTLDIVTSLKHQIPELTVVTYEKNRGKGQAVMEGIRRAKGDIVMILDADMTVPPEEMVDFFEAIASGASDFASGTRFLYPMEKEAMRFSNYLGNVAFSKLVQVIVGSEVSDTLCGTKAMRRADFKDLRIEDSAWGDFDLIFHAAKLKLKCVQVPVHYKSRVAGESKMKAFSAGINFLKLCLRKWTELP